jgi:hypothetical protein
MGKTIRTRKQKGPRYIGEVESQKEIVHIPALTFWSEKENCMAMSFQVQSPRVRVGLSPLRFRFEDQKRGAAGKRPGGLPVSR